MINYAEYEIIGDNISKLCGLLPAKLPALKWRSGDSDAQGLYLKGYHPDGIVVAVWLAEAPFSLIIDARHVTVEHMQIFTDLCLKMETLLSDMQIMFKSVCDKKRN